MTNNMFKTYTAIDDYIENIEYGKIIEFSGANNSYKTSCMLSLAHSILSNDNNSIVLYFDCDNHMRNEYLNDYGINAMDERFIVSNTNDPNRIIEVIKSFVAYAIDDLIIIIDSVSNISFSGSAYKGLNNFLIQITKSIHGAKVSVLITNQYRYDTIQKKYVSYCSKCFNLYSSLRFNIKGKQNDLLHLTIAKNKITGLVGDININVRKINYDRNFAN